MMTKKQWEFELDGESHKVEFRHSNMTHKRSITLDGEEVHLPKELRRVQWDSGTEYPLAVGDHDVLIATRSSGFSFEPQLYVDGRNVDTGMPYSSEAPTEVTEEAIQTRRRTIIALFLMVGIGLTWWNWRMVTSTGRYLPYLALLGPVALVMSLYYILFPDDPWEIPSPIPVRLIVFFILAFALGIANWFATDNGLYFLLF